MRAILDVILLILQLYTYVIIVVAIMSWLIAFNVINTSSDLVRTVIVALDRMTEPLYRPIRRFMPDLGALDLTPMVVLLLVIILQGPVRQNLFGALMQAAA